MKKAFIPLTALAIIALAGCGGRSVSSEASSAPAPSSSQTPAPSSQTPAPSSSQAPASSTPAPTSSQAPAPSSSQAPASSTPAPTSSQAPAPSSAPTPEPSSEPAPEPSSEPAPEPSSEPAPEPSSEPEPEPSSEPSSEISSVPQGDVWTVTITNKDELTAEWKVGGANREIGLEVTKNGVTQNVQVLLNEDEIEVECSNTEAVVLQGLILKAIGGGKAIISVTVHDVVDSFEVEVSEPELVAIGDLVDKTEVQVRGVVTTIVNGGFVVEDATGAVLVFTALPDGIGKGDYVKVCGSTSFYHTTITEIGKGAAVLKLSGEAPDTPLKDNPVALTGEGYAADVANITKGETAADLETIPAKWRNKFEYVTFRGTVYESGGYKCVVPDDLEAKWPIEPLNFNADVVGLSLELDTTYDFAGYLTWDAKYAYGGFYVDTAEVTPTTVTSIDLLAAKDQLLIQGDYKESMKIEAILGGVSLKDVELTWETSNAEVVAVDDDGVVTAVGAGTATITCSWGDVSDSIELSVLAASANVTGVTIGDGTSAGAVETVGHTIQLTANVTGDAEEGFITDVKWESSNEEVATIDENGLVTVVGAGHADITATTIGLDADGNNIVSSAFGIEGQELFYGSEQLPLSVGQLLHDADLIVPLDPNGFVYSTEVVTVQGKAVNCTYSDQYKNYTLTLADLNDASKTIKVTGAVLDAEKVEKMFNNDIVVIQDYLEAAKTNWALYRGSALGNPKVIDREAGLSALSISAEHATVEGVEEGNFANDTLIDFTVTPDEGYQVDAVKVNGKTVEAVQGVYSAAIEGDTAIVVETSEVGQEIVSVVCDFTTKLVKHNNYGDEWTYGDYTIAGAANNNGGWAFLKFGGKAATIGAATYPGTYVKTTVANENAVNSVVIDLVGKCYNQDNEKATIHIEAYSDAAMTDKIGESDAQEVPAIDSNDGTGQMTFVPNEGEAWAANSYYKVAIDIHNTTTYNGVIAVAKISFNSIVVK